MKLIQYKAAKMVESKQDFIGNINPNYQFVETVDTATQDDITSIEAIYTLGQLTNWDYITILTEIATQVGLKGGFNNLNTTEKRIYANTALGSKTDALSTGMTGQQWSKAVRDLSAITLLVREERGETLRLDLSEELKDGLLTIDQSNTMFNDVSVMLASWIKTKNPEFIYFILSTNQYAGTGLAFKEYGTPARCSKFVDRIIKGVPYP